MKCYKKTHQWQPWPGQVKEERHMRIHERKEVGRRKRSGASHPCTVVAERRLLEALAQIVPNFSRNLEAEPQQRAPLQRRRTFALVWGVVMEISLLKELLVMDMQGTGQSLCTFAGVLSLGFCTPASLTARSWSPDPRRGGAPPRCAYPEER